MGQGLSQAFSLVFIIAITSNIDWYDLTATYAKRDETHIYYSITTGGKDLWTMRKFMGHYCRLSNSVIAGLPTLPVAPATTIRLEVWIERWGRHLLFFIFWMVDLLMLTVTNIFSVPVRDIWPHIFKLSYLISCRIPWSGMLIWFSYDMKGLFLHLIWLNEAVQTHIRNAFNYFPYQSISQRSNYFDFWYQQISQNSVLIFWHDLCHCFSEQYQKKNNNNSHLIIIRDNSH